MKNNNLFKNKMFLRNLAVASALLTTTSVFSAQDVHYDGGAYVYLASNQFEGDGQSGQKDGVGRRDWPDGSRYEGEWRNNEPNGKGIKTYKDGAQYSGEFKLGLREGKGTMRWPNGVEYSGEWKNDQTEGEGSKHFTDGTQYDGHFSKGLRNGWGTYTYADKTRYEGDWRNDLQEGKGTLAFPDGGIYKGEFKQGQPHGQGELKYANGDRYIGQWEKGTISGKGTLTYAKGGSYSGQWYHGLRNGKGEWASANGSIYNGSFVDDKPHGDGTCTDNGQSQPCRYKFGNRQDHTANVVAAVVAPVKAVASTAATGAVASAGIASASKASAGIAKPGITTTATSAANASAKSVTAIASNTAAATPSVSATTNTQPYAVQAQEFRQSVESAKQKITLTPDEQLAKIGSGVYFTHPFDKLALSQPPTFSWWSKNSALFSDNLNLTLVRGSDQMVISIASYKGPGVYSGDQYNVRLTKDGKLYTQQSLGKDKIQVSEDKNGWISGTFTATLTEQGEASGSTLKLDKGVFKLSNNRPDAATALTDATVPKKPLLQTMMDILK